LFGRKVTATILDKPGQGTAVPFRFHCPRGGELRRDSHVVA
jgi:hypothetical protein